MGEAKKARSLRKGRFTRAVNSLNTVIDMNSLSVTVKRRYEDLTAIWKIVQDKHDEYVNIVDESEENELWINELCDSFSKAEIRTDEYIQTCTINAERELEETQLRKREEEKVAKETLEKAQKADLMKTKLSEAINRRKQESSKVEMHLENIQSLLTETDIEKCALIASTLPEDRIQLENNMIACQQSHMKVLTLLQNTDEENWMIPLWKSYNSVSNEIRVFYSKHNLSSKVEAPHPNKGIQLEKLKFESFDGNIRRYPKFKYEFQQHIQPMCNQKQVAFVLKSYLTKDIQEEVEMIAENVDDMWKRLDKKYGDKGKLIDSIMADIKDIKPLYDDKSLLNMIKTIDKAHNDLEKMGLQQEINNATIVSMIEEKMSEEM